MARDYEESGSEGCVYSIRKSKERTEVTDRAQLVVVRSRRALWWGLASENCRGCDKSKRNPASPFACLCSLIATTIGTGGIYRPFNHSSIK